MVYATLYDTTSISTNGTYYWWAADSTCGGGRPPPCSSSTAGLARDRFNLARARIPSLTAATAMTHRTARAVPASRKLSHARTTRRRFRDYRRPQ